MRTLPYDLLALDLDGTLLGPDGRVSDACVRAVAEARSAGLIVTVCTGRGLAESRAAIDQIAQDGPVVVAGGAILADPVTGRTLHRFGMDHTLAGEVAHAIVAEGAPALVLKDAGAAGFDYLVVTGPEDLPVEPITQWWFDRMGVEVRTARNLETDEHPEYTVRVGACGAESRMGGVGRAMERAAGTRATMHRFLALDPNGADVLPDHAPRTTERVEIVEAFDPRASKWSAVQWLAGELGFDHARVAAIGDEINDLELIRSARLGVAMGNAVEAVKRVADRVTATNREDGVAMAIRNILDGTW